MSIGNKFSTDELKEFWKSLNFKDEAIIDFQQQNAPDLIKKLEIDLSNAPTNPKKLGFAFKSIYIQDATDADVSITFRPFSNTASNDEISLSKNDTINFDSPIQNVFLDWKAQSGKTITIIFILKGNVTSGSIFTQSLASGIGDSVNIPNPITLTTAAKKILDVNNNRIKALLNCTGDFEISGTSGGNYYPVGSYFKFENTAELYAKVPGGAGSQILNIYEE